MTFELRTDSELTHPSIREDARERAEFALARLAPRIARLQLRMRRQSRRQGGQVSARISGTLEGIGTIHVRSFGEHHEAALNAALDRFRRAAFRSLERSARPRAQAA